MNFITSSSKNHNGTCTGRECPAHGGKCRQSACVRGCRDDALTAPLFNWGLVKSWKELRAARDKAERRRDMKAYHRLQDKLKDLTTEMLRQGI